jgi:thiamine-monophosphate kinase
MAAMNAKPTQIVIGMAVSNRFSLEAIEEIYAGIKLACEKYHVDLVGGDTTSSVSGLMLSVTVIGKAKPEEICYRKGASENDLLCVSGDLGGAYMGLLLLEREKAAFKVNPDLQPDLHGFDYVLQRQLKPEARLDITDLLRKAEIKPTSMIDISDGLASEIKHLCKASGLGCQIYEEKIPIDVTTASVAEEFKMIPSIPALNGGEDYELLFTVSLKDHEKISAIPGITIIGHMTENQGEEVMITPDNQYIPLKAQGWDALIKHSETE